MNQEKTNVTTGWYSNDNIYWVLGRSIFAVIIIFAIGLYVDIEKDTLIVIALVPMILGTLNTFSYLKIKKLKNETNKEKI